jgi:hypothetical protein
MGSCIEINCAAILETLLETEFLGCEAGAFTDAECLKPSLFEKASGATLFSEHDEHDAVSGPSGSAGPRLHWRSGEGVGASNRGSSGACAAHMAANVTLRRSTMRRALTLVDVHDIGVIRVGLALPFSS